jgi:hypothetical protein
VAFTSAVKVQIRRYLGWSLVGNQRCVPGSGTVVLDSAITTVESLADGGATEALVTTLLASLATLELKLAALWTTLDVVGSDDAKLDAARGRAALCAEGRRLVGQLADVFNVKPLRDVFSPKR